MQYPISEIFTSVQGEGLYSGTLMTFVRLAGCSVGKPYPKDMYKQFPIYTEKCTLYDGREFPCDTDYRVKERLTPIEILERVDQHRVCITGGEPLIHNLTELINTLHNQGRRIHLETSGTISIDKYRNANEIWVTVSPKKGVLMDMVKRANEIKLLIDEGFDFNSVPIAVIQHPLVFIHPVNFEHTVNPANLQRVMELQKKFPYWRVGLQLHKALEHFLDERVR